MALYRYRYRGGSVAARVVSTVFGIIAFILALHIVFVLLAANETNTIVNTVKHMADFLAAWFKNMFTLGDARLQALLNYGLAAIVYLAIGGIIGGLIDRRWPDD
ncbi:hypothetical protein Afil01_10100 [Actinorhabdospora filicis]|uniref:Uncharacterized protein n=1 Tax=Actinorhabdospora filicis TaxID=1785913 RepID=A0A9W6SH63_9ACTN|nr:hypothetical protein [Actinorhabdospora filicis]GLZ76203.1 hypothetical protein Afil01_10100 [Actinorhabdospora filicis]